MVGSKRVLVYGYYHKNNLGDDLFVEAFRKLFPDYLFEFTNFVTEEQIRGCDSIFIGGGSFLDNAVHGEPGVVEKIEKKPVAYVGVGLETEMHEDHVRLLKSARLVAARSRPDKIRGCLRIPDLAYSISGNRGITRDKTVLVLPNVSVVPQRSDPHWKHAAWSYFLSEYSQFLDELIVDGYSIEFFPMCRSEKLDDMWAVSEIISRMDSRERRLVKEHSIECGKEAIEFFSTFSHVVTQRYHGEVISRIAGTRCVTIAHHDKLECEGFIRYYGMTKRGLRESFDASLPRKVAQTNNRRAFSVLCKAIQDTV